jgi:hypothetical protein
MVGASLRYSLYLLGLPPPEAPPVRFLCLRPYLDGPALTELLAEAPGGPEVAAALLDPGGSGALPASARRLAAAASFHRLRLALFPRVATGPQRLQGDGPPTEPAALLARFRGELSRSIRPLGEALLAELLASLARREARSRGREMRPCLAVEPWRLRRGRKAPLDLFGPPDPFLPSWAETPAEAERALSALAGEVLPPSHRLRGRFLLVYRATLDRLSPLYRAVAEAAAERSVLAAPEDAFFLPFDLAADLTLPARPAWLPRAVAGNRREYEAARGTAEPAEQPGHRLGEAGPAGRPSGPRPEWTWAPLLPLL